MLETFLEILESSFEEYDDSLMIISTKIKDGKLFLELTLHFEDEENIEQYSDWELVCYGVRQHKIVLGNCLGFDYYDENSDHVLKWKYTKPYCSVSFFGKPKNAQEIIGSLYDAHIKVIGTSIPFHTFFNMSSNLEKLISGGFGLLSEQIPEPLAIAYENILKKYGISASRTQPNLVSYWDGERHTTEMIPLSLLILGESEIIAEKFEIKKVSSRKL